MSNRHLEFALLFDQVRAATRRSIQWRGLRCGVSVSDRIMIASFSGVITRLNRI